MQRDRVAAALAEQMTYYRRAAGNFDSYEYGSLLNEVASRLHGLPTLSGDVLEIACGAGQWTGWLAESARSLTAIDAAPEMIEYARRRLSGSLANRVELICADVFDWRPRRSYQTVFFAFWLSHVPPSRFEAFWQLVAACLAPEGVAVFIDDGPGAAAFEQDLDVDTELPTACRRVPHNEWDRRWPSTRPAPSQVDDERQLSQPGYEHRVIKVLHDPEGLARRLADLGWAARVEPLGETFIIGRARTT